MPNLLRPDHPPDGRPSALKGLASGLLGGLVGSLAMVTYQALVSRVAGSPLRAGEHDVAGDGARPSAPPSTVRGARELIRRVAGVELPRGVERPAGRAFHFAFGAGLGGAYGVLAESAPFATLGVGVPFGALQVVFADETSVPALGLSDDPRHAPAASHLRALGGHLVYGVVTELVRRSVRARF